MKRPRKKANAVGATCTGAKEGEEAEIEVAEIEVAEVEEAADVESEDEESEDDDDDEEEFEVSKIMGKRLNAGNEEYLVAWVGYTDDDTTWEPYDNLRATAHAAIAKYEENIGNENNKRKRHAKVPPDLKLHPFLNIRTPGLNLAQAP